MDSGETPTVLIVEDEESVAESYELYLNSEYDVRVALNGGEALVALSPGVDVVLLDRRMPGMSGDEVLEHIADLEYDCRVVMVTAIDPGADIVDLPFDDYLSKPVDTDDLVATVEKMVRLDRYEDLLSEYNSVVNTYATLNSTLSRQERQNSDELAQLADERDRLRGAIDDLIDEFEDEATADVFREAHHAG